jgi:competence CoiA-like predicted nuclease
MRSLEEIFHSQVTSFGIKRETFYCPVCNRNLPVMAGVIKHDNVPHPEDLVLGEPDE